MKLDREGNKVVHSWPDTKRTDRNIAGYALYRSKGSSKFMELLNKKLIDEAWDEDMGSETGSQYFCSVSSLDKFGKESDRSPISSIMVDIKKTMPPGQLFVRKQSTGIEISWPINNEPSISAYHIYRRQPNEKQFVRIGTVKPGQNTFLDKRFLMDKLYIYAISIVTQNGESEKSIEKTFFTSK